MQRQAPRAHAPPPVANDIASRPANAPIPPANNSGSLPHPHPPLSNTPAPVANALVNNHESQLNAVAAPPPSSDPSNAEALDEACRQELIRRFNSHGQGEQRALHSDRAHTPGRPFQRNWAKRKVDTSRLCPYGLTKNDWIVHPVGLMKVELHVITTEPLRPDMYRFSYMDQGSLGKLWNIYSKYHPWFKIPDSIPCGRTFARDELDVIYLDHMFNFVNLVENRDVQFVAKDLPIFYLRDSLLGRRWNQFSQLRDVTTAMNFWHRFGLWIPHDTLELRMHIPLATLQTIHPEIFSDWSILCFPAGVPAPAPPALFYFYDRIKNATGQAELFWKRVLEHEYAYIFVASWWHECERGQKAFIVPQWTITWIRQRISLKSIVDSETYNDDNTAGTTFEYILDQMLLARYASVELRHVVRFPKTQLPPSYFVITSRKTGHILFDAPKPLPWFRCPHIGRLFVDIDVLHAHQDARVHQYSSNKSEERNMWNFVIPMSMRSTFLKTAHSELRSHLDTLELTTGGQIKPMDLDITDEQLATVTPGDDEDITRFCCPFPPNSRGAPWRDTGAQNVFFNSPDVRRAASAGPSSNHNTPPVPSRNMPGQDRQFSITPPQQRIQNFSGQDNRFSVTPPQIPIPNNHGQDRRLSMSPPQQQHQFQPDFNSPTPAQQQFNPPQQQLPAPMTGPFQQRNNNSGQEDVDSAEMRYRYASQLTDSMVHQNRMLQQQQRLQRNDNIRTSGRGWNVDTRNGLYGAGPIAKRRENTIRPFQYFDTSTLRAFATGVLRGKFTRNPTDGEINGLMHELRDMSELNMTHFFESAAPQ